MSETSRKLGQVKITQVQPNGLKHIVSGSSIYDPSRIVAVPLIYLSSLGVEGQDEQGERSLDIHHIVTHPWPYDHFALIQTLNCLLAQSEKMINHQGIRILDQSSQFLLAFGL